MAHLRARITSKSLATISAKIAPIIGVAFMLFAMFLAVKQPPWASESSQDQLSLSLVSRILSGICPVSQTRRRRPD